MITVFALILRNILQLFKVSAAPIAPFLARGSI